MKFLRKILKDEKGTSVIMIAVAIVVIFGFGVVAIDMSLIQLAKTQLQNAADAAALAGAVMLFTTSGSQEDKEAAATAEAIRVCGLNVALQDIDRSVVISAADVTFPDENLVRCSTGRGDMVTTYFLKVLDPLLPNETEITATATAGVEKICGTNCLKPFCPPDRWDDVDGDSLWDDEEPYTDLDGDGDHDPGEPFTDVNGDSVWNPAELYDPEITGYKAPDDVGDTISFRLDSPTPSRGMFW
ncbi:MAG: Tad domain-containing protein [Candidatus Zixiibacteriota bacterium]